MHMATDLDAQKRQGFWRGNAGLEESTFRTRFLWGHVIGRVQAVKNSAVLRQDAARMQEEVQLLRQEVRNFKAARLTAVSTSTALPAAWATPTPEPEQRPLAARPSPSPTPSYMSPTPILAAMVVQERANWSPLTGGRQAAATVVEERAKWSQGRGHRQVAEGSAAAAAAVTHYGSQPRKIIRFEDINDDSDEYQPEEEEDDTEVEMKMKRKRKKPATRRRSAPIAPNAIPCGGCSRVGVPCFQGHRLRACVRCFELHQRCDRNNGTVQSEKPLPARAVRHGKGKGRGLGQCESK